MVISKTSISREGPSKTTGYCRGSLVSRRSLDFSPTTRGRTSSRFPAGYEVDDLPQPVSAEFGFASYHSKAEVTGNILRYSRTFEVKDPSVPLAKIDDLKKLYRIIASDERNTAVLKPIVPASAKN